MKKIYFILGFLMFFIISCTNQQPQSQVDIKAERAKIEALLEQYVVANEEQDIELMRKIWSGKESIVMIGTDSDERIIGRTNIINAIENQFGAFENTFIAVSNQMIVINETANTAWFNELLNYNFVYKDEAKSFSGIRFTGVLEKNNDKWCLVQQHISIPAEVEMNEVY